MTPGLQEHIQYQWREMRTSVVKRSNEFYGTHWGYNFFRYSACDACDDVFAETADISVGDAWLDGYIDDPMGKQCCGCEKQNNWINSERKHNKITFFLRNQYPQI